MIKKHIYAIVVKHYDYDEDTPVPESEGGCVDLGVSVLYTSPNDNVTYYYDTYSNRKAEVTYIGNKRYYSSSNKIPHVVKTNPWLGKIEAVISHKKQLTKKQLTKAIESHLSKYITTRNNNE